jgi:hypothetical protein
MEWDDLAPTDTPSVRHCTECDKDVHLCNSTPELVDAIRKNLCVCIPAEEVESYTADETSEKATKPKPLQLLGVVVPQGMRRRH